MSELIIQKRMAQIRYPWTPVVYSVGGRLAKQVSDKFTGMSAALDRFAFRNDETFREARFSSNLAWVGWESVPDKAEFIRNADWYFARVTGMLEIRELAQVSYRVFAFWEFDSFDVARDRVMEVLVPAAYEGTESLGGKWEDLAVTLEDLGERGRRVVVGPIRKEEFRDRFTDKLRYLEELRVDVGVFIDVDVWCRHTEKWGRQLLLRLCDQADELAQGVAKTLCGEAQ